MASPIFFWKDIEIWLYILAEGIDFNNAYRLGYDRVGCWCCPNNNIRAQFLSRIYMPEKAKAWRSFLLDFASRIGKLDPEVYVDTGKWKARQGGNGLPSANDVKIRFTNCTAEDHAKIYRLVRSFDDELVGMFTPFGRVAPELGKKLLKEVVVLDSRTNVPILSLQPFFQDGYDYAVKVASETSGKQLSQHCIRFDNIIRKHGDKLSEASIAVLRANLIARILKFKTKDYEDVKTALMLCSGLAREDLDGELQLLENEYALLGFDEHAGCFDFMEDSRGAHEYKIKKKQLTASWKADFKAMFKTAKVLEIGEFSEPQETSFGTNHKILTNEWKFTQEVLLAEDLTEDLAYEYVAYWRTCKSAAVPKGRLIWVYVNKDTSLEYVERLQKIAGIFEGVPIVILLLNDVDGRLASALTNYDILDRMPDSIRQAYERAYSDDFSQAEQILSNEFDNLRKHREHMGTNGIITMKKRLQVSLTEIFEQLYPQTISFNFDGLLTASNNFTGKGSTYFCQIVKMLLSNNVNYDTIHDFTSDVRSKITAVLMESSATSWRCISDACAIMPPTEEKARAVYEDVVTQLNTDKFYDCKAFFEKFCYPPYGLSEEVSTLMLSVILANYSYCVRISYHDTQNSITRWKNELIVKDKKINLALLKESRFILINTDAVEAKFQQLFNRLNASTDIDEVIQLKFETEKYEADNGIPESLVVHFKLACSRFDAAEKAKKLWGENTGRVAVEALRIEADSLISKAMIDDVVFYFRKLNAEERIRCLNLITSQQ